MASRSASSRDKTSSVFSPPAPRSCGSDPSTSALRASAQDDSKASMRFATRAIHVGQEPDPATGATIVPIYQTSTYTQDEVGVHRGYDYSRTVNPTRSALEKQLASL